MTSEPLGRIILLNGASSSGKTRTSPEEAARTIAAALAEVPAPKAFERLRRP